MKRTCLDIHWFYYIKVLERKELQNGEYVSSL